MTIPPENATCDLHYLPIKLTSKYRFTDSDTTHVGKVACWAVYVCNSYLPYFEISESWGVGEFVIRRLDLLVTLLVVDLLYWRLPGSVGELAYWQVVCEAYSPCRRMVNKVWKNAIHRADPNHIPTGYRPIN